MLHEVTDNHIKALATELECDVRALASTLLVVAVSESSYLIMHIGDGVIGYLEDGEVNVASYPKNGEFSNITTFVTSSNALESMEIIKGDLKSISGFILMSDGTAESLYHRQTKSLSRAVIKLMQRTIMMDTNTFKKQLLTSLSSIIAQKTNDDCSIAILARPMGLLKEYDELSFEEKCELFRQNPESGEAERIIKGFDELLLFLVTPKDLKSVIEFLSIKKSSAEKKLKRLSDAGLITRIGALYSRNNV
jgi:hypothetical protein